MSNWKATTISAQSQHDNEAKPAGRSARATWAWAAVVGLASFAYLAAGRQAELFFIDESSYVAQAFYGDLVLEGRWNDPAWLDLPAIDQPPLAKYLVGLALRVAGYRRPSPAAAVAWQREYNLRPVPPEQLYVPRFATPEMHDVARWPTTVFGAVGCVAVFGLGTLAWDRRVGLAAAALLAINPLYRQQAHRALNDVPSEALALASCAVMLWAWRRFLSGRSGAGAWAAAVGAGVLGGVAVLTKLTGLMVLIQVAAWVLLALVLRQFALVRRAAVAVAALVFAATTVAVFIVGNPTLTAHPTAPLDPAQQAIAREGLAGRFRAITRHRTHMWELQQGFYPHYAVKSLGEKVGLTLAQGFGRFSPMGPAHSHQPVLYDWVQDKSAVVWIPWVALGAMATAFSGRRQLRAGDPPAAWSVVVAAAITLGCVALFLPMAWDRYFLPIQSWNSLLAASAPVAVIDAARASRAGRGAAGAGRNSVPVSPSTTVP
jgi:4-amino-4-deoxy-L-arabinose transferase-like glycosyltransferase